MNFKWLTRMAGTAIGLCALAGPAQADDLVWGGKLLLTNGISNIEGASGGGLATWAVIAGNETRNGIGGKAHYSYVTVDDFDLRTYGAAMGFYNRVEVSIARQDFDTGGTGVLLGLGQGFTFRQDVFGAKLRLIGDAVYDQNTLLPQIAVGFQYKHNNQLGVINFIGGGDNESIDYYVAATKLFLGQSLLVNATMRLTKGNQTGILGFEGDQQASYTPQFEGSLAYLLSRRLAVGGEYRTKPDNLGFAKESDWYDVFAAYALNRHLTLTAAYVDLGSIATFGGQRGAFLSAQASF